MGSASKRATSTNTAIIYYEKGWLNTTVLPSVLASFWAPFIVEPFEFNRLHARFDPSWFNIHLYFFFSPFQLRSVGARLHHLPNMLRTVTILGRVSYLSYFRLLVWNTISCDAQIVKKVVAVPTPKYVGHKVAKTPGKFSVHLLILRDNLL